MEFLLFLIVLVWVLSRVLGKGVVGETVVKAGAWLALPSTVYRRYHNVTLPTASGTTQIDHVFVSVFGVFVVETKNMGGRIFGREHDREWTQVFPGGKNHKFQNPLHQNYGHVRAMEDTLEGIGLPKQAIKSVVVFVGEAEFEREIPHILPRGGAARHVRSFQDPILTDEQVAKICTVIESSRMRLSRATNHEHIQNLKRKTAPDLRICPECGLKMVLRTARRGPAEGKQFWGCEGFPKCRLVQKA